jgi:hypothetical protein
LARTPSFHSWLTGSNCRPGMASGGVSQKGAPGRMWRKHRSFARW